MAVEMPLQVVAVAGAEVVQFPWIEATAAVAAVNSAVAALAAQREARASMAGGLSEWAGGYRAEFDGAFGDVTAVASGLEETLAVRVGAIVDGAEAANEAQTRANSAVEA